MEIKLNSILLARNISLMMKHKKMFSLKILNKMTILYFYMFIFIFYGQNIIVKEITLMLISQRWIINQRVLYFRKLRYREAKWRTLNLEVLERKDLGINRDLKYSVILVYPKNGDEILKEWHLYGNVLKVKLRMTIKK